MHHREAGDKGVTRVRDLHLTILQVVRHPPDQIVAFLADVRIGVGVGAQVVSVWGGRLARGRGLVLAVDLAGAGPAQNVFLQDRLSLAERASRMALVMERSKRRSRRPRVR